MKHLWCEDGYRAIAQMKSKRTLYAFDFDGTLAPIAANPQDVHLTLESSELLRLLSGRFPVAIISGRSVIDLRTKMSNEAVYFVGNHGAEGLPSSKNESHPYATCVAWLNKIEACSKDWPPEHRIFVEDKGLSLSLHFRAAEDPMEAERFLLEWTSHLSPMPRTIGGKCVLNLIPGESAHKGDALLALILHFNCEQALFVGDDVTDESVFELPDIRILGVRVGHSESSRAPFYLRDQNEVSRLMAMLLSD